MVVRKARPLNGTSVRSTSHASMLPSASDSAVAQAANMRELAVMVSNFGPVKNCA